MGEPNSQLVNKTLRFMVPLSYFPGKVARVYRPEHTAALDEAFGR